MFAKMRGSLILIALCAGLIWAPSVFGALNVNVLNMDGNGDFVSAVDADNLTNFTGGAFTIQAWIFVQQFGSNQPIVSKFLDTGNQRSWAFMVTSVGQLRAYVSSDGTNGGTIMWQTNGAVVATDTWQHAAFVCNPGGADKIKFYVDNVEKAHTNSATNPPASVFNSTASLYVGRFLSQYFYGYMDEVRLTNGVLASFPSSPLDLPLTPDADTQVLYHFDESSGTVNDHANLFGNPTNTGTLNGNAQRTAWDVLGPNNDLPLPVTLIALAANPGNQWVNVNWITESEIDNLGFHVYRSTNQATGYTRVTTQLIPSQGFALTTHNYTYTDNREVINGVTYYYKLSDIDVNGRERQHETVASATPASPVMMPGDDGSLAAYQLSQNYPNPFNVVTTIRYYVRNAGQVRLAVYDISGKEIALLINSLQSAGEHLYQFNAASYPAGIYFVRLTGENGYDNMKKMLFLK
jgi:hypothetical protein